MRSVALAVICILGIIHPIASSGQTVLAGGEWNAMTKTLERAVLEDDADGIARLRADFLRLAANESGPERALAQYTVAYADWRLSFNPSIAGKAQTGYLDEAETQLKAALKLTPNSAETLALLSSVYGAKIAHSPISGILLGPRSSDAIDGALKIAPDNARLLLTKGVGKFNTPSTFGGSVKEAESYLRRALDAFTIEPPDKAWPNWGRFDAHAWLGQVLAKTKNRAGARAEYDEALKIAPKSGWVRYVLVPALDKDQ
jgi:tetratricopeptide (TPR) repeat protein